MTDFHLQLGIGISEWKSRVLTTEPQLPEKSSNPHSHVLTSTMRIPSVYHYAEWYRLHHCTHCTMEIWLSFGCGTV